MVDNVTSNYMIKYTDHEFEAFDPNIKICKKRRKQYVKHCEKQDAAGKQARGRLAWLDISLPQRGAEGLTTIIPAVFRLLTNK